MFAVEPKLCVAATQHDELVDEQTLLDIKSCFH